MSKVKGKFIENEAITSEKIADGSVDTIDLKDGAVTMDKLSSTVQTTLSELQNDLDTKAPKLSPTLTTPTTDVISLTEQSSSPATPASGTKKFYAKNDGKLYSLDSDGNEEEVGAGGTGGVASAQFMGGGTASWLNRTNEVSNTEEQDDAHSIGVEDGFGGGPVFTTPTRDVLLTSVSLRLKVGSTPPSSGTFSMKVFAADGSNIPTGSALATSPTKSYSLLSSSADDFEFTFSSPVKLSANTTYVMVMQNDTNGDIDIALKLKTTGEGNLAWEAWSFINNEPAWSFFDNVACSGSAINYKYDELSFNFTEDIKLALPGLSPSDNIIEPPDAPYFLEDGEFLYVVPNDAPGGAALEPAVTTGPIPEDALVVAFRDGDDLVAAGYRMKQGYQAKLGGGSLVLPPTVKYLGELTTTGSWTTNTTYTGKYWRDGDRLRGQVLVAVTGQPDDVDLVLNLPSALSINTDRLSVVSSVASDVTVSGMYLDNGTGNGDIKVFAQTSDATKLNVRALNDASGESNLYVTVNRTAPIVWASGDSILVTYEVPISGWENSSNIVDVAELELKTARMSVSLSSPQSVDTATLTPIEFDTEDINRGSGLKLLSDGSIEALVDGDFFVHSEIGFNILSTEQPYETFLQVSTDSGSNWTTVSRATKKMQAQSSINNNTGIPNSKLVELKNGHRLRVAAQHFHGSARAVPAAPRTHLSIFRVFDMEAIAAIAGKTAKMPEVIRTAPQRTVNYSSDEYVPIVASGSNSDGHWVRYADGTQICRRSNLHLTYFASTALTAEWIFPASFSEAPAVFWTASANATASQRLFHHKADGVTVTKSSITALSDTGTFTEAAETQAHCLAVGRWK